MALPMHDDLPPLPPDLAAEAPPIPDTELDQLLEVAVADALEAGISPAQAVGLAASSEGAPRWRITDLGGAEWAMRHVVAAEQAVAALEAQRQAWAARIDLWFTQAAGREQARRAFFAGHLEQYAVEQREATGGKTKTLALPSGRVRTTEHGPKAAVEDDAKVAAWVNCWYPDQAAVVCPPVPPKVYVQPLREHTTVVEVIDLAELLLASGELVAWARDGMVHPEADDAAVPSRVVVGDRCPLPGDGWPNPEAATDLVARVEVLAAHLEVHDRDGRQVPGTKVEPGWVSAAVQAQP